MLQMQPECLSKSVADIESDKLLDTAYLDFVSDTSLSHTSWQVQVKLNDANIQFKLDTGAEVSAISDNTLHQKLKRQKLEKSTRMLLVPSRRPLDVIGQFTGRFQYRNSAATQTVYVIKGLKRNLLGLPTIVALNLATRVDATTSVPNKTQDIKEIFPSLFSGLGNLGGEYEIKLYPNAIPHALYTARYVALPLRPKVREELKRMERLGIISRVEQPTEWCTRIVVVLKPNKTVRVCVDLKPRNENVKREVYPLPSVDNTLAQLTGAKVFSKLYANSGFWQIPLAPQSRLLTTFITPFGRYYFNKLPFGISSAPEHFQKRMTAIIEGVEGTLCLMDDGTSFRKDSGRTRFQTEDSVGENTECRSYFEPL